MVYTCLSSRSMRVVLITDASTAQDRLFTTDASSGTGYLPPSLAGHPNGERPPGRTVCSAFIALPLISCHQGALRARE